METTIHPSRLFGEVRAIASKSTAHRLMICAALSDAPTRVACAGWSDDIKATADCLTALGARIERDPDGSGFTAFPMNRRDGVPQAILPCAESGSTFRFLLPVVCALGRDVAFDLKGRLPNRPISPLYEELLRHGAVLSAPGETPFVARRSILYHGAIEAGLFEFDAGVSSQFVSGLLFATPLLTGDSELRLLGRLESFPYIELTIDALAAFGIDVGYDGANVFHVRGGQTYASPGQVTVEGDWSNAAFWLCAGAINGAVSCAGLNAQSKQGDRAIVDVLKRFGGNVEMFSTQNEPEPDNRADCDCGVGRGVCENGSGGKNEGRGASASATAVARQSALRGIDIDASDIPDLVPILSVVAAVAEGTTVIRGAGRLRLKESDRLAAMVDVLRALGADASETRDGLVVRGTGGAPLRPAAAAPVPRRGASAAASAGDRATASAAAPVRVSSWGDHRIAMAASIAAAVACDAPVTIVGSEAVGKSYPGFFSDMRALGASATTERACEGGGFSSSLHKT